MSKKRLPICPIPSPCYHCAEKVPPSDTSNGCRTTCEKYAIFRAKADRYLEERRLNADATNEEYDRLQKVRAHYRRLKK